MLQIQDGTSIADFAPAEVLVAGKTSTEKRLGVAKTASRAASMFLVMEGGKVGKQAAQNVAMQGLEAIARATRRGNYSPLAETLACINAESVIIGSRATYEALDDIYRAKSADIDNSKNGGYSSTGKPNAKRLAVDRSLSLLLGIRECIAAMDAHE